MVKKAAAKAPEVKKTKPENPLFPKRPKNFRIGGDIRVRLHPVGSWCEDEVCGCVVDWCVVSSPPSLSAAYRARDGTTQ